ncbi:MAG: hypothetical protein GY749_18895 [Desulfobacteraceae bacterium]|nr:hypothetical protein [Desulfobacteraceae bacterium]
MEPPLIKLSLYHYLHEKHIKYTQSLDILLKWGRIHLFQQDTEELRELEQEWEKQKDHGDSLDSGLEILKKHVEQTLDHLHGSDSVDLDPDEALYIKSGLRAFDSVIFLAHALEFFPDADNIAENFHNTTEELVHQVIIDREPPGLRLIPFNNWRREILKNIPFDIHYLFPWYSSWAELPEEFHDTLAENWHDFIKGQMEYPYLDKSLLNAMLAELESDSPLFNRIRNEARLFQLMPEAVEQSLALRLFAIQDQGATPDYSENTALAYAAVRVIDIPVRTEAEKAEQLFFAGFCGPFLDTGQRLDLLSQVENYLKQPDVSQSDPAIIEKLCLWAEDRLTDERFVQEAFSLWESKLASVTDQTAEAMFLKAVENIRNAGIPVVTPSFNEILQRIFSLFPYLKNPLEYMCQVSSLKKPAVAVCICLTVFFAILIGYEDYTPESKRVTEKKAGTVITRKIEKQNLPEIISFSSYILLPEKGINSLAPLFEEKPGEETVQDALMSSEKKELDNLRLSAIIMTSRGNRALFEDASGRGYIAAPNTVIGIYRISDILKDRVIIEKTDEDFLGKETVRKRELTLQN